MAGFSICSRQAALFTSSKYFLYLIQLLLYLKYITFRIVFDILKMNVQEVFMHLA